MIEIVIPGEVVPKGRPRFSRHGGVVRTHTPNKTLNYERVVKMYAIQQKPKELLVDAIEVDICVHRIPPKSWSKVRRKRAIDGEIKPVTKPDVDNYAKAILDALNGIVFKDDNQIVKLTISKIYAPEPKAVVRIKESEYKPITEQPLDQIGNDNEMW